MAGVAAWSFPRALQWLKIDARKLLMPEELPPAAIVLASVVLCYLAADHGGVVGSRPAAEPCR